MDSTVETVGELCRSTEIETRRRASMRRCGALNKTSVERRACCVRATYALTVPTADSVATSHSTRDAWPTQPSWRTPEFIFYGICYAIVVPCMLWIPYVLSRCMTSLFPTSIFAAEIIEADHPNFQHYKHRLSPGWIPGRLVVRVAHYGDGQLS